MKYISTFFVKSLLISLLFVLQFSFANAANCPGTSIPERPALPGKGCCGIGTNASLPYWDETVGSCLNVSCTNKPGPFNLFQLSIGWNAGPDSDPSDSSLSMNIPYTYAPVNTGEKCEFRCVYGTSYNDTLKECTTCSSGGCGVGGKLKNGEACKNGAADAPFCTPPTTSFRCDQYSPDPNAVPCLGTASALTSNLIGGTSTLVASCSPTTETACEYTCRSGYYKNGSICSPYTCQDTAGKLNAYTNIFAKPDNLELTNNTTEYSFSSVGDTAQKCQFNCVPGSAYSSVSGTCEACSGTGCTVNQCDNGSDNPPLCDSSPVYSCTGTVPSNASECPLSHVVSVDTSIPATVNHGSCDTTIKCQYECDLGYRLSGGVCVPVNIPILGQNGCVSSAVDWSNALTGSSCHLSGINLLSGESDTVMVSTGYFPTFNTATRTVDISCTNGVLSTNENSVWCGYSPTCQNKGLAASDPLCQCTNIDGVTKTNYLGTSLAYINNFVYSPSLCSDPSNEITSTCISSDPNKLPSFQSSANATYASCVTRSAEFDSPTCEIGEASSTCQAMVYATTTNLTQEAVLTDANPSGVYVGYPTNKGVDVPVPFYSASYIRPKVTLNYGTTDQFQIWDATSTGVGAHSLIAVTGSATCASGLSWNSGTGACEKDAVVNLWSDHINERVSYGNDVKLSWRTYDSKSCMASGFWSLEKGTSTGVLYEEFRVHNNSNNGGTTDPTDYTLSCVGASGVPIATTTSVYGCKSDTPVASTTSCLPRPEVRGHKVKFPYATPAILELSCLFSDTYDVYKEGVLISPASSTPNLAFGANTADDWTATTSIPDPASPIEKPYSIICHRLSSDGVDFTNIKLFQYKATPPSPVVSLRSAPANIVKGATTVITWDVLFPNSVQKTEPYLSNPCVLTAKAICLSGNCGGPGDPRQIEEDAINVILTSSSTDTRDKNGSRLISSSTQYLTDELSASAVSLTPPSDWLDLPYDLEGIAPYSAWKASGRKTFKLNHSMNFNLKCGDGANESRNVRVMVTDNIEG